MNIRVGRAVVCLVGTAAVVLLWLWFLPPDVSRSRSPRPWPLYDDIKRIGFALAMYRSEYDAYPYDARGPAYALRGLRPYLDKLPGILPDSLWLRDRVKIENTPIHYTNEPERVGSQRAKKGGDDVLLWVPAGAGRLLIGMDLSIAYEPTSTASAHPLGLK